MPATVRVSGRGTALLAAAALVVATAPLTAGPARAVDSPAPVPSTVETEAGSHAGDTIDDPAIWVHPTAPERSLVMANDKQGAFDTYDLSGNLVQRLTSDTRFWGNVDVRQGVPSARGATT